MAISTLLLPSTISFSKNFIPVKFLSDSYLDSFGVEKENYRVYVELWVENAANTSFELINTQNLPLVFASAGQAQTDLKDTLHAILEAAGPDYMAFAQTSVLSCKNSVRKFYLKYAESVDGVVSALTQTADFVVIYGGFSYTGSTSKTLLGVIRPDVADKTKDKFLRQYGLAEYTRTNQPQSLYFFNTRATTNYNLRAKFYFSNAETFLKTINTGELTTLKKFAFNIRFDQIITDVEINGRTCTHYEFYLENIPVATASPVKISETRTFYLNYLLQEYVRYFIYWSSWGAINTLITFGKASSEIELKQSEANRIRKSGYDIKQGDGFSFDLSINNSFKCATGFLSQAELFLNRDFYLSPFKFRFNAGVSLPISITSKTIPETTDGNGLYAQNFDYKYLFDDDAYTENDADASVAGVGGVGAGGIVGGGGAGSAGGGVIIPPSTVDLSNYVLTTTFVAFKEKAVSGDNTTKSTFLITLLENGLLANIPSGFYTVPNAAIIELIPSFSNTAAFCMVMLCRHFDENGRFGFALVSSDDLFNKEYIITFGTLPGKHKIKEISNDISPTGGLSGSFAIWDAVKAANNEYGYDVFVSHQGKVWKSQVIDNIAEPSILTSFWNVQPVENLENAVLLEDVTSNNSAGGILAGTLIPIGTSFTQFVKKLLITAIPPGTTTLTFTQLNLVAMGNGSFKLPLVLAAGQAVLAIKVAITSGSTYQMPASEWSNNEIINFDSNVAQTITVITS